MFTPTICLLATALLGQPAGSLALSGVVVDRAGMPMPDVEVMLAARMPADGSFPTLARTMTDRQGAFRLEVDRQRLKGIGLIRLIWAYRPGQAVTIQSADLMRNGAIPPVRLTLAEPLRRTLTILDSAGHPLAGVRLAPVSYAINGRAMFFTPDDWVERLTVASGADGVAALPYLPATIDPLTVQVTAPGFAPHNLPLPYRPGSDRFTLKLGRPARLAGSVYYSSGQPAANVPVEVWVDNLYHKPSNPDDKIRLWPTLIHFDSGPVRTRPDGSFVTPHQLMTGSSYRIMIRPEGEALVASDWLPATTELTTAPTLRLRQRRKLVGLVHDRQGQPVAGARVFLPSGQPTAIADARGHFLLEGDLRDRTYLLVQADGFRSQGWPAVPARQPAERTLILVRTSESPDRLMAPLSSPISVEESRGLARRALEPSLQRALEKGDDDSRGNCLRLLCLIDPARALELLETRHFENRRTDASLRYSIATELLATDPVEAESIVAAIAIPAGRARGYVALAEALPAAERDRKRRLLEHATVQANAPAGAGRGADSEHRLTLLAQVADAWLDLGEVEKARPLISEGLKLVAALPPPQRFEPYFLQSAARLELDRVLFLIRDLSTARRRRSCYIRIALALASEHPAEAERIFELVDDSSDAPGLERKNQVALRLCLPMAKTDSRRAQRLIAELKTPREQACAWALVALGLADRDKPGARSALAESIRLIERLGSPFGSAEVATLWQRVALNPAASILPIVEKVAPERLEDVFWKAVALMPKDDMARERGIAGFLVADFSIFLARYDRQVADVFLTQAMATGSRGPGGSASSVWSVMRGNACVDPQRALALFEALPRAGPDRSRMANRVTDEARDDLITSLVEPIDEHWKNIWRASGIPLDQPRFR